jgi:glycosyltransferase involved in cell wall biosynthesis
VRAWRDIASADRVLATTWPAATFACRIRPDLDVVAHGSDVTRPPLRRGAFRRVWRHARAFAMSRFLGERLAEQGVEARVLPAPVDVAPAPKPPGDGTRWAFVARAIEEKGGDRFVRICAAARARGVVVGDGPARASWEALAARLGADVTFTGSLDAAGVRGVLLASDLVFLLPRGPEGLGLTLIEGAALGVPAVGCRAGGVPEAVGPGLVLDDPDDAAASAQAIRAWWLPAAGEQAWTWCRDTHGTAHTLDAVDVTRL